MTYRARAQGRSARRREWKAAQFNIEVEKKVALKPPRIERVYVAARPPVTEEKRDLYTGEVMMVHEMGKRPDHRVVEVPIIPAGPEHHHLVRQMKENPSYSPRLRTVQLQAQVSQLQVDNTLIRWWSWTPVNDALKPETRVTLGRALGYGKRVREVLEYMGVASREEERGGLSFSHPWKMQDLHEWLGMVIEDVEQALGKP